MTAATALVSADLAEPQLAAEAVSEALARAGHTQASSVLLFLTPEFVRCAHAAVTAAARAAGCLNIHGCTVPGVLTEQGWCVDRPAAAALVLTDDLYIEAPHAERPVLCFSPSFDMQGPACLGGICAGNGGHPPGRLWSHGRLTEHSIHLSLHGVHLHTAVARGVRVLSAPMHITEATGFDVLRLDGFPALNMLARELPLEVRELDKLPLHQLFACVIEGDSADAMAQERFELVPLVATNSDDRSVTLGRRLAEGRQMFWGMRQPMAAERDMHRVLDRLATQVPQAAFGLLLSCLGRGPYFYGGEDCDLAALRDRYPGVPLIGAYFPGQIVSRDNGPRLVHNAAIIAMAESIRT